MADQPRQLAIINNYSDLVQALRARRDELDIPHVILDEITGLAEGHVSKLLAPTPMKILGPVRSSELSVFPATGRF